MSQRDAETRRKQREKRLLCPSYAGLYTRFSMSAEEIACDQIGQREGVFLMFIAVIRKGCFRAGEEGPQEPPCKHFFAELIHLSTIPSRPAGHPRPSGGRKNKRGKDRSDRSGA